MTRAKRKNQRYAQRQDARSAKTKAASNKNPSPEPPNRSTSSRIEALPTWVRLLTWLGAAAIIIAIPSFFLYTANNPTQNSLPLDQSIEQQISDHFAYGFSQADISKEITLQSDDAMSIKWIRLSNGSLQANYQLGPYSLQNVVTAARLTVMVPAGARIVQCGYADLNAATNGQGTQIIPILNTTCTALSTSLAEFFTTPLVPNEDQHGLFYLDLSFIWQDPTITNLGIGKAAVFLHYQGRFSIDPAAHFFPADTVKIHYNTSTSGDPTGLPRGVYLEYQTSSSETVTSAAPPPNTTSEDTQTWVADADHPTYDISVLTEDTKTNDLFQLGEQGIFLIIGGAIGATFPRLLRKRSGDDGSRTRTQDARPKVRPR
jgi:hypothetical protein